MRLQLTLSTKKHSAIPLNYNGYLAAWIYKVLFKTNHEFAEWLHEKGVGEASGKSYKLFTFSPLRFRPFQIDRISQQIRIDSSRVYLTLSFYLDDAMKHFVTGLFQKQQFGIGTHRHRPVDFKVDFVEVLPEPTFTETMRFKAFQPICISRHLSDHKYATYLSPTDENYMDLFFQNLVNRYEATQHFFGNTDITDFSDFPFQFQHFGRVQRKGQTFKGGTKGENKIIGYQYEFEVHAPVELNQLLFTAGAGEKNSLGFGYVDIRK